MSDSKLLTSLAKVDDWYSGAALDMGGECDMNKIERIKNINEETNIKIQKLLDVIDAITFELQQPILEFFRIALLRMQGCDFKDIKVCQEVIRIINGFLRKYGVCVSHSDGKEAKELSVTGKENGKNGIKYRFGPPAGRKGSRCGTSSTFPEVGVIVPSPIRNNWNTDYVWDDQFRNSFARRHAVLPGDDFRRPFVSFLDQIEFSGERLSASNIVNSMGTLTGELNKVVTHYSSLPRRALQCLCYKISGADWEDALFMRKIMWRIDDLMERLNLEAPCPRRACKGATILKASSNGTNVKLEHDGPDGKGIKSCIFVEIPTLNFTGL